MLKGRGREARIVGIEFYGEKSTLERNGMRRLGVVFHGYWKIIPGF